MPDGLLRDCDWRISVQKQSDSLRLSSSTKLYTTSVSLNRETRQEWKRAGGAWSLNNVGTVSRLNPPTRGKHVSVFPGVCVCVRAQTCLSSRIGAQGLFDRFARICTRGIYFSELKECACRCLWTGLQRHARLTHPLYWTPCNDYNSEAWKHTHTRTQTNMWELAFICRESP